MNKITFVKLGGSLITDKKKSQNCNETTIKRLANELARAQKDTGVKLIVGNGGGSFSHPPSKKYNIPKGIQNKKSLVGISEVQDLGSRLNRILVRNLIDAGCNAISINPSSCMITTNSRITSAYLKPLIYALNLGMTPVVYGDVIFDAKMGCSDISTEIIFNYIAKMINKDYISDRIVYCGTTNGVYDKNKNTISEITNDSYAKHKDDIYGSDSIDVTGGMRHKVNQSLELSRLGVKSIIINGSIPDNLFNALIGKKIVGTIIY